MDARPTGQRNRAQPIWRKELSSERGQLAGSSTSRRLGTFATVIASRATFRSGWVFGLSVPILVLSLPISSSFEVKRAFLAGLSVDGRQAEKYARPLFHDIPQAMLARMRELERIDSSDRTDGTPRMKRLRQIPLEVGKFIAIVAAAAPAGRWVEIGTSAGYSTLWLALACRATGRTITTYEILDEKAELARQIEADKYFPEGHVHATPLVG